MGLRPEAKQPMTNQTLTVKFQHATADELKALDDAPEGFIAGWASTANMDSYEDIVVAGAFDESIATRGLSSKENPKGVKLLLNHDSRTPAGRITKLEMRDGKLWIEAQLNLAVGFVKDFYELAKDAGMNFSVGFSIVESVWKKDASISKYEYREITKADLREVSLVMFPANEDCEMIAVKSDDNADPVETVAAFEKMLMSRGLVSSRNDARRVTQEVKSAAHLFAKSTDAPDAKDDETTAPLLDAAKFQSLSDRVAQARKSITRS